jgi:hypothetical protein
LVNESWCPHFYNGRIILFIPVYHVPSEGYIDSTKNDTIIISCIGSDPAGHGRKGVYPRESGDIGKLLVFSHKAHSGE